MSREGVTSSGRPADIIVSLPDCYELFEIKTALAPRDRVREALGQLLEYAYWPGSPDFSALWIVGPSPIDSEAQELSGGSARAFWNTNRLPTSMCLMPLISFLTGASTRIM